MLSWQFRGVIGLVGLFIVVGLCWNSYNRGYSNCESKWNIAMEKDRKEQQDQADQVAVALAEKEAELAKTKEQALKDLANEKSKHTVYRSCVLPDSGISLYNRSIQSKATR